MAVFDGAVVHMRASEMPLPEDLFFALMELHSSLCWGLLREGAPASENSALLKSAAHVLAGSLATSCYGYGMIFHEGGWVGGCCSACWSALAWGWAGGASVCAQSTCLRPSMRMHLARTLRLCSMHAPCLAAAPALHAATAAL